MIAFMQSQGNVNESVSAEIRAELARQNKTQGQLATDLGLSPMSLHRRMTGSVAWTLAELQDISRILGINMIQLAWPVQR